MYPPVSFFISLHALDLVITLVTSSRGLFRVSATDIACTLGLVLKDPCLDVLVLSLDLEARTRLFSSSTPRFPVLHPCQSPQGFCGPLVKLSGNTLSSLEGPHLNIQNNNTETT